MNHETENTVSFYVNSPLDSLQVTVRYDKIVSIHFNKKQGVSTIEEPDRNNPLKRAVITQFEEYFVGKRYSFDLPLSINGTPFQIRVWEKLRQIPYGKTISYSQLARRLGDPRCIRAAATANGRNPFAIVIPCHRVVAADGSLTGYAGGIENKGWLLEHENSFANGLQLLF